MAAHAKFVPSIATSSPGAFEAPLQSPLSTSMSSHHQSSERSGWRDEGHEDDNAAGELAVEAEELVDVKDEQGGWMEGEQVGEHVEEGEGEPEGRWADEGEGEHPPQEVDDGVVYAEEEVEDHHKEHHDDGSHLHDGQEHVEADEGAHAHVGQAEDDTHPDDAHANDAAAAAANQGYVYPHEPAPAQQQHANGSRSGSGPSSPYHANGAQAGYPSQHLQQQHPAPYTSPYPTTGSQAYYGVPSTHPLQASHYPTGLPPSYGSPSAQHQAYPTAAYGYPSQQPYSNAYSYLPQQGSGSNQYGSPAGGAYRPNQQMHGHQQHQLALPHLGQATSASRTGVDETGRMSAAHSEHSYDQNDPEGREALGRLLEHGVGIDQSGLGKVGKMGSSSKSKKRKSEGDGLGGEGGYDGEDGSELGGEGEDGEHKKRKRSSLDGNGNGPKDKKHVCPECQRAFARAYNLKVRRPTYRTSHCFPRLHL